MAEMLRFQGFQEEPESWDEDNDIGQFDKET